MKYIIERYSTCERFNNQYQEIYRFLLRAEKLEYNEHFPWGRFEWMQIHTMLEEDKLTKILLFRDVHNDIVGMATHDTFYDDRVYLLHTTSDKALLYLMVDAVLENESGVAVIKANSKDIVLAEVLQERQFARKRRENTVLQLDLSGALEYSIPDGYEINPEKYTMDPWQYQLMIHKGFDNEGIPEPWPAEVLARGVNPPIRTFAIAGDEYCAHCGLWYTEGDTAYVEPVATVPEHRKKGLAKAAIYEACNRARKLGAVRATVLSDQEFYHRIGFECSSEVYCWEKKVENGVQLLRAEEKDAEMIQGMQQVAFAELLERYQDHDMSPATESLEKITWKITHSGSYYYFVVAGDQTVGAIRVLDMKDGSRKRISPLYIMPNYRGKGYAQAAIVEAERIHGANHWQLDTILQETGNCYLYEKMGYHQTGRRTVINDIMTIVDYEKD